MNLELMEAAEDEAMCASRFMNFCTKADIVHPTEKNAPTGGKEMQSSGYWKQLMKSLTRTGQKHVPLRLSFLVLYCSQLLASIGRGFLL